MKKAKASLTLHEIMSASARVIGELTDAERDELRGIGRKYIKQLSGLSLRACGGDAGRQRSRIFWMLSAPGMRLVALILSYPRKRRQAPLRELKALSHSVNMRRPSGDPVRAFAEPKASGSGVRIISSYGIRSRAGQRLTRDVLQEVWGANPCEYVRRGRGREKAVQQILQSINGRNTKWIGEIDIRDCYPSFDRKQVCSKVPLPAAVTNAHILIHPDDRVILATNTTISENSVRSGLSQGSIPSSYVASKLLQPSIESVGGRLALANIDNFYVGGVTQYEAETKINALASSLASNPSGPFSLKYKHVYRVGEGDSILGYRIRRDAPHHGGRARALPARSAIAKEERKLLVRLIESPGYDAQITERWANDWPTRFPLWPSRQSAPITAEIKAISEIWSLARAIRRILVRADVKHASFQSLRCLNSRIAVYIHQGDPDWSAIEKAMRRNPENMARKMSTGLPRASRLADAITDHLSLHNRY